MDDRTPPAPGVAPDEELPDVDAEAAQHTQDLLAEHVPLALLVDLADAQPPSSEELLASEGLPDEEWWEPSGDRPSSAG